MKYTLYDFQIEALKELVNSPANALCVLPMGSGKSVIIDALARYYKSLVILVLCERIELAEQLADDIDAESIYCASLKQKEITNLTVATIQSIRKDKTQFDLIIIDEAHKFTSKAVYVYLQSQTKARIIGFTATPYTSNGFIYGDECLFKSVTYTQTFSEMINRGYLVPLKMKSMPDSFIVDSLKVKMGDYAQDELDKLTEDETKLRTQVIDALSRLNGRNKVIWFCININHAEKIKELIGESVTTIHSKLSNKERVENFRTFKHGDIRHLTFVTVIAEGINIPAIDAVVVMRPTQSPALLFQTVGRGMRTYKDKKDCLVLDYGCAFQKCGTLDNPIINKKKRKEVEKNPTFWICEKCYNYVMNPLTQCECGFTKPKAKMNLNNLLTTLDTLQKLEVEKVATRYFFGKKVYTCEVSYIGKNKTVKEFLFPQTAWGKWRYINRKKQLTKNIKYITYTYNKKGYPEIKEVII